MGLNDGGLRAGGLRNLSTGLSPGTTIPDSGLEHDYDATALSASDGSSISTFTDQQGSLDLTGNGVYRTSGINGNPSIETDGDDDKFDAAGSTFAQPNHIFMVAQALNPNELSEQSKFFSTATGSNAHLFGPDGSGSWGAYSGAEIAGGSTDTNPHVFTVLFDGANSYVRVDGTEVASGDIGGLDLVPLALGYRYNGNDQFINAQFGRLLHYSGTKGSSEEQDIELALADQFGIAL